MSTEEKKPAAAAIGAPAPRWQLAPKGLPQMRACLEAMKGEIARALPKHVSPERMLRVAQTAMQTVPKLAECTTLSVVGAIVVASQLGLELGGPLGQAYLVPFKPKDGPMVATLIPGYRGMIDLARRSGSVSVIDAVAVHKLDRFRVVLGVNPTIEHEPYMGDADPGAFRAVYARCLMRDGTTQFVYMTAREVESVRRRSKSGATGPWSTDFAEMAKKTAIRRLWKVLPVSVEKAMAKAIVAHDRAEDGEPIDASGILDGADVFGTSDGPELEVVAREEAGGEPKTRTRRTAKVIDQAPEDPAAAIKAELVKIHERIRAEDPEAFAVGWNLPEGQDVKAFDLTKQSVDALTKARDDANDWAERNPPASDTQTPAAQAPRK